MRRLETALMHNLTQEIELDDLDLGVDEDQENESVLMDISEDAVLERGLLIAGFDHRRQQRVKRATNVTRFRTWFGSRPNLVVQVWNNLQTSDDQEVRTEGTVKNFESLLLAMFFLRRYQPELISAGIFKINEKSVRERQWEFVKKISALKHVKIVWPDNWGEDENTPYFLYTVDGVHALFHEVQHGTESKDPSYYSHKTKSASLAYELALHLWEPRLIHMYGPVPAGQSDLALFRKELKGKTPAGKKGIADRGYDAERGVLSVPNSQDPEELRRFKSRARARQESFNARIKMFSCLRDRFRHKEIVKQQWCFEAVCVIVQYQMELGEPVFSSW